MFVPQYEGTKIELILGLSKQHPVMLQYLPEERDWHRLPRQWVINLFATILGKPFQVWVDAAI